VAGYWSAKVMRLLALLLMIAIEIAEFRGPAAFGASSPNGPVAKIVTQLGHARQVNSAVFSPDGKLVLSGSDDNALKLWDVASGRELRSFTGHGATVTSVAISPNGRLALSGSNDASVRLWELVSGRELGKLAGHRDGVSSVAFTPDGRLALSGSWDRSLKLWDLATGRTIRSFAGHRDGVTSIAISADGKLALSGSRDKTLKLWDLESGSDLRTFTGHGSQVNSVAFSADGKLAMSGSWDHIVKLWDLASGQELRSFDRQADLVFAVALSPDGKLALSGARGTAVKLWDVSSGRNLRNFTNSGFLVSSLAFSPDGTLALAASDNSLKLWEVNSGRMVRVFAGHSARVKSVVFFPDGRLALSGSDDAELSLWDVASAGAMRSFTGHKGAVTSVALSPDGKLAISGSSDKTLKLWDLASGRDLRSLDGDFFGVDCVAITPDGRLALSGGFDGAMKLWDLSSGQELRRFKHLGGIVSAAFSPDGALALSGGGNGTIKLWDVASGGELRTFTGHNFEIKAVAFSPDGKTVLSGGRDSSLGLWDVASGQELRQLTGHRDGVTSVSFSPDGKLAVSGSWDHTLKLWDLASGHELRSFVGHEDGVTSVAFSPDGKKILSSSYDGTLRLWNLDPAKQLGAMVGGRRGEWLTITPEGFFSGSQRDTDMITVVRGVEATTIGQVYQSLFNPDLVREALAGDLNHEVEEAAKVINLDKVLDAGPPPSVAIISHGPESRSSKDLVTVAARVTDRGKGIGRIEWRLNGITAGVMSAPAGPGPDYDVTQDLALDPGKNGVPGENRIEVMAYEGRNLLASLPAQTTVVYDGPADTTKPKLFVLAIGINKYVDKGWNDMYFPPLTGSVPDAKAFTTEMEKAAAGQYEKVRVTLALDADATVEKLDETVTRIANEISPRDTFVLYAAAHGYSFGGNYYMIPQDYQGGPNPEALKDRAVSQEHVQEWLAKRIKAKRAIILLDTCESGALTGGYAKSRTEGAVSEAAVGRLHEAIGRPVITAASPGKSAYENYKGHGVFTYALIEALHKGDTNNNGKIEVTELAAHVEKRVPELFAELKQSGWVVKGLTAVPVRRGESGEEDKTQTAHFGSTGEDFSLVARLP
jgi:WD40 repeat protein